MPAGLSRIRSTEYSPSAKRSVQQTDRNTGERMIDLYDILKCLYLQAANTIEEKPDKKQS